MKLKNATWVVSLSEDSCYHTYIRGNPSVLLCKCVIIIVVFLWPWKLILSICVDSTFHFDEDVRGLTEFVTTYTSHVNSITT